MSKEVKPKVKKADKPAYDPKKNYGWEPTDTFTLSGSAFGIVINLMLAEKEKALAQLQVLNELETLLKEAVEAGVAVERPAEGQG